MSYGTEPTALTKSSPMDAVRSVFASTEWGTNLLWFSIAALLQSVFVGQIALFGYGSELIARRGALPGSRPVDVDSNRLGDYLSKGIWPFLVHFVANLIVGFCISIPVMLLIFVAAAVGASGGEEAMPAFILLIVMPLVFIVAVAASLFMVPFLIRAMICQDFMESFDFGWAVGFYKTMFMEMLVSGLIFGILTMLIALAGMALCFVGYIPALGIVMGASMNLLAQWYEVYLYRGGTPVEPPEQVVEASVV